MNESERPYIRIPVAPPEWEEHIQKMKEWEQEEKEALDDSRGVIIIDI